jgi:hypothetical protein
LDIFKASAQFPSSLRKDYVQLKTQITPQNLLIHASIATKVRTTLLLLMSRPCSFMASLQRYSCN